jgi:hypothetical protein
MIPISEDPLSLLRIADYWSRQIPYSARELLQLLVSAWWRGEIVGESAASRLVLLRGMFKSTSNRDLIFLVAGEEGLPKITARAHGIDPDGIVEVDARPTITVPSADLSSWTEESCIEAFCALAKASLFDDYPRWAPPLWAIELAHTEFMTWVSRRGFDRPTFWSGTTVAAEEKSNESLGVRDGNTKTGKARGPKPFKRQTVEKAMEADINSGRKSANDLNGMLEKELAAKYECSRSVARDARNKVLARGIHLKLRQTATNDK